MNDIDNAPSGHVLKKPKLGNWKLNTLMIMLVFVIIGQLSLLGSLGQLYKKLNYVENYCTGIVNQSTIKNFDLNITKKPSEDRNTSSGYPPDRPR